MDLIQAIKDRCAVDPSENGCHIWTLKTGDKGYPVITFKRTQYTVHREVLAHKLGRPLEGKALHTCDNPKCCNPDHLYEGTTKQNAQDMMARGRGKNQFLGGEKNPSAKLTQEDVKAIRATPHYFGSNKKLALQYGVSPSIISQIRSGKLWT